MRSFISTFCIFTFVPLLLASGVAGRPIRIRDITQTMASDARATTTKAEPTYPLIFTHKVDFTGPGADSISGVIESTSNTIASASVIIDTSSYVEATASPSEAKQTSTSASTSPTAVALPETYNPQVAPSIITSTLIEPIFAATPTSLPNAIKMPVYTVPVQAAPQKLEQMTSIDRFAVSSNLPDATVISNLKEKTHTLAAPWGIPSTSSTDSILFNKSVQVLFIALLLVAAVLIGGLVYFLRFYWKRFQRARTKAAARSAITDDKILPIEQIEDYKRPSAPAGLEWQLRAMKENASPRRSPKSRPTPLKPRDRVVSAPDYYTPRKSKRSELAAFVRNQEDDDDSSSIFDYYFNISPTEDEAEIECTSRKSLDSSMEKEKQTINSSFEHGDLAGQTINGFRLYLPLTPSPLRHGFVPL